MFKNKKIYLILLIFIIVIIDIFLVLTSKNTTNKFNNNTILIDEKFNLMIDVSKLTITETTNKIIEEFENKNLNIYKNKEIVDSICFKDLNIETNIKEEIEIAKNQNDEIYGFNKLKENKIFIHISCNVEENKLKSIIKDLNCINQYEESKDAYLEKDNNELIIKPEFYGTQIDENLFIKKIINNIENNINSINLDEDDLYIKPSILNNNKNLLQKVETFNKCVNTQFSYLFGDIKETVSKEMISNWIYLDNKGKIIFDENSMLLYIKELANKYNTFGTTRTFITTTGEKIKVPAGDYGWAISQTKEVENLKNDLLKGGIIQREPTWLYTGYGTYVNNNGSDISNNYVEINISKQHLWVYVNGELKVESDFVSGNESNGNGTPSGVFGITYKTKNATLKGQGYSTPVDYWMPFNMNIGMHDASWRNSFGGTIYKTSGSHGCINLPPTKAEEIYTYMDTFFPIVVYKS